LIRVRRLVHDDLGRRGDAPRLFDIERRFDGSRDVAGSARSAIDVHDADAVGRHLEADRGPVGIGIAGSERCERHDRERAAGAVQAFRNQRIRVVILREVRDRQGARGVHERALAGGGFDGLRPDLDRRRFVQIVRHEFRPRRESDDVVDGGGEFRRYGGGTRRRVIAERRYAPVSRNLVDMQIDPKRALEARDGAADVQGRCARTFGREPIRLQRRDDFSDCRIGLRKARLVLLGSQKLMKICARRVVKGLEKGFGTGPILEFQGQRQRRRRLHGGRGTQVCGGRCVLCRKRCGDGR